MGTPAAIAKALQNVVNQRSLTVAMTRSVLIVEAAAKREAPVRTGRLRRSISSRVEAGGQRGIVTSNVPYGRAVHDGTRPHLIRPVRAKALFWKGAAHPVRVVHHPGNRANPYMTRAMVTSTPAVERELQAWGNEALGTVK